MTPTDLAELCQLLARSERWPDAIERIRVAVGATSLSLHPNPTGPSAPGTSSPTRWSRPLAWEGTLLGAVEGDGPVNGAALELVLPLIAWSLWQRREQAQADSRMAEIQVRASRALDLSELVTWLLHARDAGEVERLGTSAVASVLKVDAGALMTRDRTGAWSLRLPSQDLTAPSLTLTPGRLLGLLRGDQVEFEGPLVPEDGPVEQQLWAWGYRHTFCVPLDSGVEPLGLLFALSKAPPAIDGEARVAAAQLAIMISVALDRLSDQRGLAEHRKSLEDALRLASMGTWELDLATLVVSWSKEFHQLLGGGFTEVRHAHEDALRPLSADERVIYERHLHELLGTGSTLPWQAQLTSIDGRRIWLRTLFELVRDADGVPSRVSAVTRDVSPEVSSQRERERALERATKYERLFSLSDTLAMVCSADGFIEELSPSWTRQFGYEPLDLLGVDIANIVHPDDRPELTGLSQGSIREGHPAGAVSRVKAKSGEWRWLSWTAALDGGRFYAAATDVTSLQETSQRLRRSEEQLLQASGLARVGGWDYDVRSRHMTWSDEVKRLHEVPVDFVPGPDMVGSFYAREDGDLLLERLRACIEDGAPYDVELEVITAKGHRQWVRHQGQAEQVDGKTVRIFGAIQDIAEQRRGREEAIAASKVKSQFLANTSHEIRTPLNGILGMTQLALETPLNPEQREYLQAVHTSGQNLLAIVNDILDISKIESGRLELERVPFSLSQAVFEAVRNQASRAHARALELVVDLDPAMPDQFVGDPVRVGQIVTNLVGNAVKFTERGEVCVTARLEREGLHLQVRDTGIGIPPDRITSIFDAFTQADGSTNRRFGGTGLGLTITLELVKAMGGRIEVESTPNVGSTFHVWLALPLGDNAPRLAPPPNGLRVMVVSDHPSAQAATARQLGHLGYAVVLAEASSAMRQLLEASEPVHVLVVDQELEQTSGVELAEALGQHDGLDRISRVLLTRTTSRPAREELLSAGVRRVLTRPVAATELAQALAQLRSGAAEGFKSTPSAVRPTRRALKVLLAEDNAINARLAQRLLERLGHTVEHVTDGALAVEAVGREPWDAVLMDMQMPVLDGLDATRRIRLAEGTTGGHLPIIALTANAMKGDDQTCLTAGMDAYLTKPIDLERLAAVLDELAARPLRGMSA